MKINEKLIKKIVIELKKRSESELTGIYKSLFKGEGIEFENLREYTYLDEYKNIEWNTSSRTGKLYVKEFKEERNIPVYIAVDISSSMNVSLKGKNKVEYAAELSAIIGAVAVKNGDPISLTLFSSKIEAFSPLIKDEKRLISNFVLILKNKYKETEKTDFSAIIEFFSNRVKRRSIIFIISDFLPFYFEKKFLRLAKKNNLFFILLKDPFEVSPPDTGIFHLYDPESRIFKEIDFSDKEALHTYKNTYHTMYSRFMKSVLSYGIDFIDIMTDKEPFEEFYSYFKKRYKGGKKI